MREEAAMTATDDTITAIHALVQQLRAADSGAKSAAAQAEKAQSMAGALGDSRSVAMFILVRELIEQTRNAVGTAVAGAENAMTRAKAIASG